MRSSLALVSQVAEKRKMIRSVNMWATRTLFKAMFALNSKRDRSCMTAQPSRDSLLADFQCNAWPLHD